MFTFSFGSAFAAVATSEQKGNLAEAEAYARTVIAANFETAMNELAAADQTIGTYTVDKATVAAQKAAVWAEISSAITDLTTAQVGNYTVPETVTTTRALAEVVYGDYYTVDALKTKIVDAANADSIGTVLVKAQYAEDFAAEVEKFDNVNTAAYADTYASRINAYVAKVKADMENAKIAASETTKTAAEYKTSIDTIKSTYADALLVAEKISGTTYDSGLYLFTEAAKAAEKAYADADSEIKTTTEEKNEATNSAANAAAVKAAAQQKYAAYMTGSGTVDKEEADAYITVYNYLADAGVVTDPADVEAVGTVVYKDLVAQINDFNTYAAKYKAEVDANGNAVRDAEAVDKIVNATTKYLYAKAENPSTTVTATYQTIADAKAAIKAMNVSQAEANLDFAKKVAVAALEKAKADAEEDYYPAEYAKVAAKYDEAIAKVNAATTVDKVNTAKVVDVTAINDKEDVDALLNWAARPEADVLDAVEKYVQYANTGKTVSSEGYIFYDEATVKKAIAKAYGESTARTAAERKNVTIDAATIAAQLSTVGGLDAAQKAAKEAIKALPATSKITVADKDAVQNAFDLDKAYTDMNGSATYAEQSTLSADIDALYAAMLKDFVIRTAQVDKTDKAALKALQKEIKDANEALFGTDKLFASKTAFPTTDVDSALATIRNKEAAAVKAAIDAIPVNVTEADKATVEAARKLYDAYVAEYTTYDDPAHNAAADINADDYAALVAAETILGLNAEDPAMAVKAFKIKASSKATKGAMTISWRVIDGDKSAAKGYQVWRSTKANKGFKKMITTKKMTYKNTKNLKKGTTYYYRVRAYARTAEGKLVFSDFSNKAYRKAK